MLIPLFMYPLSVEISLMHIFVWGQGIFFRLGKDWEMKKVELLQTFRWVTNINYYTSFIYKWQYIYHLSGKKFSPINILASFPTKIYLLSTRVVSGRAIISPPIYFSFSWKFVSSSPCGECDLRLKSDFEGKTQKRPVTTGSFFWKWRVIITNSLLSVSLTEVLYQRETRNQNFCTEKHENGGRN